MGKIASGKGTQAERIIKDYGGVMYSNGDNVRSAIKEPTPFGQNVKTCYEGGLLIPEWIASYWMTDALVNKYSQERIIFEAVAKKPDEAKLFIEIHEWLQRPYIIFNLDISDDLVRVRSQARARDQVDVPEIIEKRLAEYHQFTAESINIFASTGKLVNIDGSLTPEMVQAEINSHLSTNN